VVPVADEHEPGEDEIFEEIERRALFDLPEEDDEPEIDVVDALREESAPVAPARDLTLGGYIDVHDRVPAFSDARGEPYTVDVDVEASEGEHAFAAFFIFIRWAATGAGIMDHVESGDIAFGSTEDEAKQNALDLTLYEVKTELDEAIERKRKELED
jgi:hypothetical protein